MRIKWIPPLWACLGVAAVVFTVARVGADGNAEKGKLLFNNLGCGVCHTSKPGAMGPDLNGLYGKKLPLMGGRVAVVDDAFVEEHIMNPGKSRRKGFQPIMPGYKDKVNKAELADLVSYIKSLSPEPAGKK